MIKKIQITLIMLLFNTQIATAQNQVRHQQQSDLFDDKNLYNNREKLKLELDLITDYTFQTAIEPSPGSKVSSTSLGIAASYGLLYASYIKTQLGWKKFESLPFGNEQDEPLKEIHQIDMGIMFGEELNDHWEYGFQLGIRSEHEDDIRNGLSYYFDIVALYQLTNDWSITFGAGFEYDDVFNKTDTNPLIEFAWREYAESGFSLSFGVPSIISLTYHLSTDESVSLEGEAGGFQSYLADDTTIQNARYMEAERNGIGLTYANDLDNTWSIDLRASYLLTGNIIIKNKNADRIGDYDVEESIKISFTVSRTF